MSHSFTTDRIFKKRVYERDEFLFRTVITSKTGLQRPAARYDSIGKIGGSYGFLVSRVSMVSRVASRCPWLPSWGPWSLVDGVVGLVGVVGVVGVVEVVGFN